MCNRKLLNPDYHDRDRPTRRYSFKEGRVVVKSELFSVLCSATVASLRSARPRTRCRDVNGRSARTSRNVHSYYERYGQFRCEGKLSGTARQRSSKPLPKRDPRRGLGRAPRTSRRLVPALKQVIVGRGGEEAESGLARSPRVAA